ncbi:MAG TPA: hypothetical protein VGS14_04940 [Actinomycetes bacterium]|nr:hypothetical protein [Actinomycetes bacterium]
MNGVLLEREQEDLLKVLVEASRNVPRDQRQRFMFTQSWGPGDRIQHPGLPNQVMPAYEGDLDVLEREGLLNASYTGQRGNRFFDVSPLGFRFYEEMQQRLGTPAQQVEEGLKRYLEADAFQEKYPVAYRKWAEAEELLWASDSQQQLTTIGHLCREAMQEFATALVDRCQPPDVDTDKAHTVSRTRAVLNQHASKLATTAAPFLDALLAYWGTVSDLVQRQEHGAQKEGRPLAWEDGRRVVFQTVIVMFEVDRALELPPG